MMFASLVLGLVVMQSEPTTIDLDESFGKTAAQIEAMGFSKWYDFYIEKAGSETTMSMNFASMLYGDSLYIVNTDRLKALDPTRRTVIQNLRRPMFDYSQACVQVGYTRTGGGTMWSLFSSGVRVSAEEVVLQLIREKPTGRRATQSQVRDLWKEIQMKVEAEHASTEETAQMTGVNFDELLRTVRDGRRMFEEGVLLVAHLRSAREREVVFGLYMNGAETAMAREM